MQKQGSSERQPVGAQMSLSIANEVGLFDLKAGMTVNVRSTHRDANPMIRTLTSAGIKKERGHQWFYWRWTPGRHPDREGQDCGHSGVRLDADDIEEYRFELIAAA